MLRLEALVRRYGTIAAIDGVSLEVGPGEIVGLLGANGAGKSTLIRIVAGILPPDQGSARVRGHDVWSQPIEAKREIGYAAEEPSFYEELSLGEHLAFIAAVRGMDPAAARARAADLIERHGLAGRADEPVRSFSHGMRKKASFIAAVLHRPAVLLCDEALEGFDAGAALAAKQELRDLAVAGAAVLFSSHVAETIERLCDRVVILERGRVARTLERAEWGAPATGISPLERVFLEVHRAHGLAGVG
jgi:ABC-2 type transport system ATP-binding protein